MNRHSKVNFRSIAMNLFGAALLLGIGSNALATVITATSVVSTGTTVSSADNLINGSGLSGVGSILTQSHSGSGSGGSHNWKISSGSVPGATVTFDLGSQTELTDAYIWNYDDAFGFRVARDITLFDLAISTDGTLYTTVLNNQALLSSSDAEFAQTFSFAATIGQYVQLTALAQHGGDPEAGLGEVRFGGTAAPVPAPSTLFLLALGLLGLTAKRKPQSF